MASTPDASFALDVSMPSMRACAWVLRTTYRYASAVWEISSTKFPLPVTSSGSSRRLMDAPINCETAISPLLLSGNGGRRLLFGTGGHHLGRRLDRLDNVVVAGAAAGSPLEAHPPLSL